MLESDQFNKFFPRQQKFSFFHIVSICRKKITFGSMIGNYTYLLTLYQIQVYDKPQREDFENILGKGQNSGDQHFAPLPLHILPFLTK